MNGRRLNAGILFSSIALTHLLLRTITFAILFGSALGRGGMDEETATESVAGLVLDVLDFPLTRYADHASAVLLNSVLWGTLLTAVVIAVRRLLKRAW